MPNDSLKKLQDEYRELSQTIKRQNELRESGSDDYDLDKLDRANNRRNQVRREIKQAGGTPQAGPPPTETPVKGQGTTPQQTPTTPEPPDSTVSQLERQLKQVKGNPPHPGVRMVDGKVVGGTAKDLQEQLDWRGKVEKLEHELTGAQAEEAWAAGGGPDGFTTAEQSGIKTARTKIDAIQQRLDAVNKKIAGLEGKLAEAQGTLDEQKIEGGGPNAQSAAAIGVGAQINGLLRPLYAEQAAITKELNTALGELGAIIRGRVRKQLENSGVEVGLPNDRVGKTAVEDAFLRRVYRRMGLPYRPTGAPGLLGGLTGAQSSRLPDLPWVAVVTAVIVTLLAVFVVFLLVTAGNDAPVVAVPSAPVSSDPDPADTDVAAPEEDTTENVGTDEPPVDEPAPEPPAVAVGIGVPYGCANVTHSPLAGFPGSLSYFMLLLLVGGQSGPIPDGTELTVDAGGIAPNSAPIIGSVAEIPIPIDHYGTYSVSSIVSDGPGGAIPVQFAVDDIVVGSSEGPIGGCVPAIDALDSRPDWIFPVDGSVNPDGLWFGDTPPIAADSPNGAAPSMPDFEGFLHDFGQSHDALFAAELLETLDAATIARYGSDQCAEYLSGVVGTLSGPKLISAVKEPWDYPTDGLTTEIEDSWTLLVDLVLGGSQTQTPMHVRATPDGITWFTDCGSPLP